MTKTKAIVTQTRFDNSVRPGKCKVYVGSDNTIDEQLDQWFSKNSIHTLTFKSRAWSWLSNQRHKLFSKLIAEALDVGVKHVKFSHKAGCSCGCSPGFNVTLPQQALQYTRNNVWVDVTISNEDSLMFNFLCQAANDKLKQDKQREANKARPAINQRNG